MNATRRPDRGPQSGAAPSTTESPDASASVAAAAASPADALEPMLATLACERLAVAYAAAVDGGDADAAAACFVADGVLEMPGGRRFDGRDAIAQRVRDQSADQVSRHVLSNFALRLTGDGRVAGRCLLTLYRATRTAPGPLPLHGPYLVGEYDDEYRRTADGWRLARRTLRTVFRRAEGGA